MLKEGKVYVLKDGELRVEIIWLYHDMLAAIHRDWWKTVELVTRNYWWPEVTRDIGRYVEGCDLCQRVKNRMEEIAEKLKLSEVSSSQIVDLVFLYFIFHFHFIFILFSYFSIFRT